MEKLTIININQFILYGVETSYFIIIMLRWKVKKYINVLENYDQIVLKIIYILQFTNQILFTSESYN